MLTEKTKKIIEETNELKDIFMKQISFDMLCDMSVEEYSMFQKMIKLMDLANDLVVEQAAAIDLIHEKLDKLLAIVEKGSN